MEAMVEQQEGYRLYGGLADWWPLISPPEEYAEEAVFAARVLGLADGPVREVLELGSGGGHNASHLRSEFTMTLVDASPGMLAVSRRLNPGCAHIEGDMRTIRLGRVFDAVFVHDAVDYMTTEDDLRLVVETAFTHCRPGGVAVFVPDNTAENFEPGTGYGGSDGDDGRGARYLEWSTDPDPADTWTVTEYAFLLRDADGTVRAVHETHRLGLFPHATWLRLLAGAGFKSRAIPEETTEDREPRVFFAGLRP
jgi:SAM-dependent methyltransferase